MVIFQIILVLAIGAIVLYCLFSALSHVDDESFWIRLSAGYGWFMAFLYTLSSFGG